MGWFSRIFKPNYTVRVENLRTVLQEQESLKKATLSVSLEYKRIEESWKPYQQGLEKGQNVVAISRLNDKYLQARQKFEANLVELTNKQGLCQKGIINQILNEPALLPLLFANDFMTEAQYQNKVCALVKGHKEGKIADDELKQIVKYQKTFMVDEEPVYVKDNRTQYADTIIIDDENKILFTIRNKNDDFCPGAYCLPGGHIEKDETPRQAAQRELLEETGIELKLEDLVPCGEYIDNKSHIFYFCAHANAEPVVLQEEEQIQYEKVSFDEVDKKPLLMNLQSNLEHLIAIPKTMLNAEADNAQILYFDGKNFKKGCDKLPFVKSLSNACAIFTNSGEAFVYEQENDIEKAHVVRGTAGVKLIPKKIFVSRSGKTFLTTVWINPLTDKIEKEDAGGKEVEPIGKDIMVGDVIAVKTKRGERVGKVECLVSTKEGAYIGFRQVDGKYTEAYLKSIKEISRLSGIEIPVKDSSVEEPESISYTVDDAVEKFRKEGLDFSSLSRLGGSSETFLTDISGDKFFLKKERAGKQGQLKHEVAADAVYRAMGFEAPKSKLVSIKDTKTGKTETYKVSEYIAAQELGSLSASTKLKAIEEIKKGFALDCLLANWDVIGASSDNILVTPEGKAIRIDNGSSFQYRAKGSLKPDIAFFESESVGELQTMRTPGGGATSSVLEVFGSLTDAQVVEQIKDIVSRRAVIEAALTGQVSDEVVQAINRRIDQMQAWVKTQELAELEKTKWDTKPDDPDMPSKVTELYFENWDSFEFQGNEGIKDKLKEGILKQEARREEGYKKAAEKLGMTVGAYKAKIQNLAERFVAALYPGIVVHSSGSKEAFSKVFSKKGRFKSLFETKTGCGCTSRDTRARYEAKVFGFTEDIEENKTMRPIYGCAANNSRGYYGYSGKLRSASGYGDIFVEINREKAIKSATITTADSLNSEYSYFPVPFGKPHFTMFAGLDNSACERVIDSIEKCIAGTSTDSIESQGSYLEMQYHNQLTQDDVKMIHVGLSDLKDRDSASKVMQQLIGLAVETGKAHKVDIY